MANDNNLQRERKKNQLRQRMVTNDHVQSAPVSWISGHKKLVTILAASICAVLLIGLLTVYVLKYFWKYSSYDIVWNTEVVNASSASYVSFCDGVVVLNKDGAAYYDVKGNKVWSCPYDMSNPRAVVEGEYILIYDLKGKDFSICNRAGKTGSSITALPITKGDIAATGVVVLQIEDTASSLLTYYRNTGKELQVSIYVPLQTDGYPLDISISPNGQQLAVAYYGISGAKGSSRVDFYDFQEGKNQADRIVASFDYRETDTYVPEVIYLTDKRAVAMGDNRISFFDVTKRTDILRKDVEISGEIQRIFYDENNVGFLVREEDAYQLQVYSAAGDWRATVEQDRLYNGYAFQGDAILMYQSDFCRIMHMNGRERFEKQFGNTLYTVLPGESFGSCYLVTMEELQKIHLR